MLTKILTPAGSSLVAFILFGLTYSATAEEGILRATSAGLLAGLLGFAMSVFAVWLFLDHGKRGGSRRVGWDISSPGQSWFSWTCSRKP